MTVLTTQGRVQKGSAMHLYLSTCLSFVSEHLFIHSRHFINLKRQQQQCSFDRLSIARKKERNATVPPLIFGVLETVYQHINYDSECQCANH